MDWKHWHRRMCISSEASSNLVAPLGMTRCRVSVSIVTGPTQQLCEHGVLPSVNCVNLPQSSMPMLAGPMATKPVPRRRSICTFKSLKSLGRLRHCRAGNRLEPIQLCPTGRDGCESLAR